MRNECLLDFLYGLAESASLEARDLDPGEVVEEGHYGDEKRSIDQVAEDAVVAYLEDEGDETDFRVALKPEDASLGEDSWITGSGNILSGNELEDEGIDYALIVDQVEGTKNYDNRDRYTSVAAIDPVNPTLDGVEAALAYRWDDQVFFSDGNNAYRTDGDIESAEVLEAQELDEVDYTTKIRGQMIGPNAGFYSNFMESIVDHFDLQEKDWPSLKADGTTTGDILGCVTDESIAIDFRALEGRERRPFAQDFAPAAKIAQDAGVQVTDERGDPVKTNFMEEGSATSYVALPPGEVKDEVMEEVIPEIVQDLSSNT